MAGFELPSAVERKGWSQRWREWTKASGCRWRRYPHQGLGMVLTRLQQGVQRQQRTLQLLQDDAFSVLPHEGHGQAQQGEGTRTRERTEWEVADCLSHLCLASC